MVMSNGIVQTKRVGNEPGIRARPFIKWAGGKTRLLSKLLPFVPEEFRRYHEPFVGGGAMLFAVHARGRLPAHAADLNDELVMAWNIVLKQPEELHERLAEYASRDCKTFYYEVRAERGSDPIDRAAHFMYLNRTAWNGLYRVNRWGQFNVPWGARSFVLPDLEDLRVIARDLDGVKVAAADFRDCLARARGGDFVYLDPPYLKVSDTSKFNGYTKRRFRAADLASLADECQRLTQRGVRWLLSNRNSELIRELFAENEIVPITVRRSVAAQNRTAVEPADSPEVIVSNRNQVGP
jgi:DNA adenine methylase